MSKLAPGTIVDGRYRVQRHVGQGGAARVYEAIHTVLERPAALKVSHDDNEIIGAAMEREARYLARIGHANVVGVLDAGRLPDGRTYVASEWVAGPSLQELIDARLNAGTRGLSVNETMDVSVAIAAGLEACHGIGVVHRDIKPGNIMVPIIDGTHALGASKVIDFGVATILDQLSPSGEWQTRMCVRSGTSLYAAPEQMCGRRQSFATDIYGFGAVVFALIFGHPPLCENDSAVIKFKIPGDAGRGTTCIVVPARMSGEVIVPNEPAIAQPLLMLLTEMLRLEPGDRPTSMRVVRQRLAEAQDYITGKVVQHGEGNDPGQPCAEVIASGGGRSM
jgi:serine/threonine protein kinase